MKRNLRKTVSWMLALALCVTCTVSGLVLSTAAENPNLLVHGDFEQGASVSWGNSAYVTDGVGVDGTKGVRIETTVNEGDAAVWPGVDYKSACFSLLEPNTTYVLRFDYKNEGKGFAKFDSSRVGTDWSGDWKDVNLPASAEWTTYTIEFTTGAAENMNANDGWEWSVRHMHYANAENYGTGAAYFDNFSLTKKTQDAATSIELDKTELQLDVGKSETLTATFEPNGSVGAEIVWSTNNADVAEVSANGEITAVSAGTATITATAGTLSASCIVTVNKIDENPNLLVNGDLELGAAQTFAHLPSEGVSVEDGVGIDGSKALSFSKAYNKPIIYLHQMDEVKLAPHSRYVLSLWTKGPSIRISYTDVSDITPVNRTSKVWVTPDSADEWVETEVVFDTGSSPSLSGNWSFYFKQEAVDVSADTYVDNITLKELPEEVPVVDSSITGGDFEDETAMSENWDSVLNKASVVNDEERDDNNCLKLPKADTPIGDVYVQNVWLEPNAVYYVSFEMRGGAAYVTFSPDAFSEHGTNLVAASDEWQAHTFRLTTQETDTYLKDGCEDVLIAFAKNDADTNAADTFIDNVRVVKAGAYAAPEIKNGSIALSPSSDVSQMQAVVEVGDTVTVTVTPAEGYMLKPGSLYYVTESGEKALILNKAAGGFGEGSGDTFGFALPEKSAIVTADFVPVATQNFRFETLGTSVHYESGAEDPNGLRFLNRLYVEGLDVSEDTLTVTYNNKTYTVTEFGSLLKRASNEETALTIENVDDSAPSATRVWKAMAYDGSVMKLVDHTENYVDFTVIMKTSVVNAAFLEREYTACGYMILSDGENTVTLYSKGRTDSAGNTVKRIEKAY